MAAARALKKARTVVALTGAGFSIDSGIPCFRGSQGLWDRYDPMEFASIEAFRSRPAEVWEMLIELDSIVRNARPNAAHLALADLERIGRLHLLVTQNIDGLHQEAGNRRVVEFHGSGRRLACLECGHLHHRSAVDFSELPPRCHCGGLIKPDVVFFGEEIPPKALLTAFEASGRCDVMLVVGTSAVVAPASHLPVMAKQAGALVIEVNPEPTPLSDGTSDIVLQEGASEVLPRLVQALRAL